MDRLNSKSRTPPFTKETLVPPATVYQQDINAWKTTTITVQSIDNGILHGKHAWLICLALQFSCPHNDRFKKANIMFQFEPTEPDSGHTVVIKRWAPQFLTGRRTTSSVEWTFEGSLTAGVDLPGTNVQTSASFSLKEAFTKEYSCNIVSDTWAPPHLAEPNSVRFYINENEQSRGGIPNRLNAVLVVQSDTAVRGKATVETNGIKARVAKGYCNPIELVMEESYRPRWPDKAKEFAMLGREEWQGLATGDIKTGLDRV